MAMGSITWAFLLLAIPDQLAGSRPAYYLNQRSVQIPIARRKEGVSQYILWMSSDQGRSWNEYRRLTPPPSLTEKCFFQVNLPQDGEYWFKLSEQTGANDQGARDILRVPVSMRMIIDTQRPKISMKAERQGEEIVASWMVKEDNPDAIGPRLEYHTSKMQPTQWTPVPLERGMGMTRFNPGTSAEVHVRLQMRDRAENSAEEQVVVAGLPGAPMGGTGIDVANWTTDSRGLPAHSASTLPAAPMADNGESHRMVSGSGAPLSPSDDRPVTPSPALGGAQEQGPAPAPSFGAGLGTGQSTRSGPAPGSTGPAPTGPGFPSPQAIPPTLPAPTPPADPQGSGPGGLASAGLTSGGSPLVGSSGTGDPMNSSPAGGNAPLATSGGAASEPAGLPDAPAGSLPPLQLVNKPQVKVDLEVGKFGPSGLGKVDIYVSADDGATWEPWQGGRQVTLPQLTQLRSGVPVRATVTIMLPREQTVYGFYLVVKNQADIGHAPPRPGTPPQVRIELDHTLPDAKLFSPQPDPNSHTNVVLPWLATDRNLGTAPISLEWAEHHEGPWRVIAANLPNNGKYTWALPPQMPSSIYLRLSARDTAGNVGIATTKEPVLIDLTPPEFRVVGVHP